MPSRFRVPPARMTGVYGWVLSSYARRLWGEVPDTAAVLWHHKPVMRTVLGYERRLARWKALDPDLKVFAELATAAAAGCSWCLDFGYFLAHSEGLDERRAREVPRWRESDVFTDLERAVMEYAEAMTATPVAVTDEMVERLVAELGVPAVVELTQMVAVENSRARFNAAMGLESQGYSSACALPLAAPAGAAP